MKFFSVILLLLIPFALFSQSDSLKNAQATYDMKEMDGDPYQVIEDKDELTFIYVKKMPEFAGGNLELQKYIAQNVTYPKEAGEKRIQGTVFYRFQVKKDGTIGTLELQKGVHKILDEEAARVIRSLPEFTPGEHNGKKVNVWYSIPVSFRLN